MSKESDTESSKAILKALAHAIEWQKPWAGGDDLDGFVDGVQRYFVECYFPQEENPWRIEYNHPQKGWLRVIERGTGNERQMHTREVACELCLHHWATGKWE